MQTFFLCVLKSHSSALHLSISRSVFICVRPLSDIAVLSGTDNCSLSLSHAVYIFTRQVKMYSCINLFLFEFMCIKNS